MAKSTNDIKQILVFADWVGLGGPKLMGTLQAEHVRGKEIFSFSYEDYWLKTGPALGLDPDLGLYNGPQYNRDDKTNFGLFMDSSPDRWGRMLMQRREALIARQEKRKVYPLMESDYLMGVADTYRMGGLRFKLLQDGAFLSVDTGMKVPPMTTLRTLEEASLHLEEDDSFEDAGFSKWLSLLISPGSSLGGARPKASVADPGGHLWIAKFPSRKDDRDVGGWEAVVNEIAVKAGLSVAKGAARRFSQHYHTFLSKRFDRKDGGRIHFASAMTLLGYSDGADAASGVSYLHLAEFIMRNGATPNEDLEELWRRIVFNICVSNTDDHLRNHGFLLTPKGWKLSPAFDINPIPLSLGLSLNISEESNALDLELAREVASRFRVEKGKRENIIQHVLAAVSYWDKIAEKTGISRNEMFEMKTVFEK